MIEDLDLITGQHNHTMTLRRSGQVRRFHNARTIHDQDIAQHTFNTLQFLLQVWPFASRELIIATLHHDVAELVTGDMPSSVKWKLGEVVKRMDEVEDEFHQHLSVLRAGDLHEKDYLRMKFADWCELAMFCIEEREFGSSRTDFIFVNILKAIVEIVEDKMDSEDRATCRPYVTMITDRWQELHGGQ